MVKKITRVFAKRRAANRRAGKKEPEKEEPQIESKERLSREEFRDEIKEKLNKLSIEQRITFAQRCGLHALVYLYQQGNLNFWQKEQRQQHAYAVFNALDYCRAFVILKGNDIDIKKVSAAAGNAAAAAAVDVYVAYAAYAAYAHYAAAHAAYAAYAANAANAADAAANDAANADAANADAAAYYFNQTNIQPLLRQELQAIANNQTPAKVEFDQALLNNFEKALKNENCQYWAELYLTIFKNNFEVDAEELKQRLNVPEEIKAQGAAAVGNYMTQLKKQGAKQLNESRILILGDKGAGKTCLARRLISPSADMTTLKESTAGVDTSIWTIDANNGETTNKVRIWDFAGHTVTHAVHRFFLSERCLYILVYDGRLDNSSSLEYWLDHMTNYGGDSQAVILVNEKDEHKTKVPINKLKSKYKIHSVHYLSIADEADIDKFAGEIADIMTNNPCWRQQQLPGGYYKVKQELEFLFDKNETNNDNGKFNEIIDISEFNDLAKLNDIDDINQLLKDLTALGISLWYPKLGSYGNLVLNPEWISHGVYKIINWVANREGFTISLDDFNVVFASSDDAVRFPTERYEFLFSLIEHYELAYQSPNDEKSLIFPHLLNEDQPALEDLPTFEIGESLMLEYQVKQPVPPDTVSRFIVRHSKQIKRDDLVWREGVVLVDSNNKDTIALVKEDERIISIAVKGSNKSDFIAQLRETMNDIFASYKSDKPELVYDVIPHGPQGQWLNFDEPLKLPEQTIVDYMARDKDHYDVHSDQQVDIKPTVINYNIVHAQNVIQGGSHNSLSVDESTTINYQSCNFELQGSLNELAIELAEAKHSEEAKQLQNTAKVLAEAENCQSPAELKKSGVVGRVKRVVEEMGDKNSSLYKVIEGTKNGVNIAQELAAKYNKIAEWTGLPQVPKPFLKK